MGVGRRGIWPVLSAAVFFRCTMCAVHSWPVWICLRVTVCILGSIETTTYGPTYGIVTSELGPILRLRFHTMSSIWNVGLSCRAESIRCCFIF